MVYYFHLTKAPGAAAALALFAGGVPHALVIDPGPILDALIAISSILNLVNMVRVNLMVEEKQAQALTVQLVRVCKTSAGKGGLLSSWFGVYACPGEIGTGEFTSTNPYSSPEAVPKATTVVPMKASGVLEHCDIGAHLGRRLVPLWLTAGGFSLLLAAFIRL